MTSFHGTLLAFGERRLETVHGPVTAHLFESLLDHRPLIVLTCGDVRGPEPLLARVHSSCVTSETLEARDCDCAAQLSAALAAITAHGRGALFYLMQEGRGAGFAAKARDRMLVQASGHRLTTFEAYEQMGLGRDLRRYDEVAFACQALGIAAPLRLLSNNPEKVDAIRETGLAVAGTEPVAAPASTFNLHYLDAKRRSGHTLGGGSGSLRVADLPEPVESFEPEPVAGEPPALLLASYLLPVGVDGEAVAWFRVRVELDVSARTERVLLSHGDPDGRVPLVGVHEETLLERFPLRAPGASRRRWRAIVRAACDQGAACILFRSAGGGADDAATAAKRIARQVPGRRIRTIRGADALDDALAARGFGIEGRVALGEA